MQVVKKKEAEMPEMGEMEVEVKCDRIEDRSASIDKPVSGPQVLFGPQRCFLLAAN